MIPTDCWENFKKRKSWYKVIIFVRFFKKIRFKWLSKRIKKAQQQSRRQIVTESRDDLFNEALEFMAQHKIILESDIHADPSNDFNPLIEIEALFQRLSLFENEYCLVKNNLRVYPFTFLVATILSQGRKALDQLAEVDKDNKKVSYYENKKNASLDDLIDLLRKKLNAENEHKISHPLARREIEIKLLLAIMKKKHPLHINFYLLLYADAKKDDYIASSEHERNTIKVMDEIIEFFEIGHATPDMIYKSIAMQIFELFKSLIPPSELKEIINRLIYYSFGKDYKNFADFGKKSNYLKNIVGDFVVYDFDDEQTSKKKVRVAKILIKDMKRTMPVMRDPKFDAFYDLMATNPIYYRLAGSYDKYFGILPKNFSTYLPK